MAFEFAALYDKALNPPALLLPSEAGSWTVTQGSTIPISPMLNDQARKDLANGAGGLVLIDAQSAAARALASR